MLDALLENDGITRTDMHCSECSKHFIGELDFSINGNHIIECPMCGHEHCRVILEGKITSDRWSTRQQRVDAKSRRVWNSSVQQMQTSATSAFIRDKWLNMARG